MHQRIKNVASLKSSLFNIFEKITHMSKKKERKKIALGSRDRFFKNHFLKNGKLADTHSKDNCKLN